MQFYGSRGEESEESAENVSGPAMPSGCNPDSVWKRMSAFSVSSPKMPSVASGYSFDSSFLCRYNTGFPVLPARKMYADGDERTSLLHVCLPIMPSGSSPLNR